MNISYSFRLLIGPKHVLIAKFEMSLPPELLALIISFLDVPDRKAIRLGSRLLNELATPGLFRSVSLVYTLADLERLSHIAEHEVFRSQVRRIIYAPSRYAPGMTLDQWQHHYNRHRFQRMNAAVWLRRPYEEYIKLWKEQEVCRMCSVSLC